MAFSLSDKGGRLTALIGNIFGTILAVYLLLQFYSGLYAILVVLFALSVSATQCKSRLKITTLVLIFNIGLSGLGFTAVFYSAYLWLSSSSLPADFYITPISLVLFSTIGVFNAYMIYRLHDYKIRLQDPDKAE